MTQKVTRASVNPWLVLGLICLPVFIGSLDLTIVSAFLPEILLKLGLPLQSTLDEASWVVSGYLLAYAISMMFMGRVSDLIGRRKVYVVCLLIFVIGSVMVATAHTWPTDTLYIIARRMGQRPEKEAMTLLAIIIGRIVQALGAGALVPVESGAGGRFVPAGTPRTTAGCGGCGGYIRLGARTFIWRHPRELLCHASRGIYERTGWFGVACP